RRRRGRGDPRLRRDRRRHRRGDGQRGWPGPRARRRARAGDHDHAPAADRVARLAPLPGREGFRRPDSRADHVPRRTREKERARTNARRRGVPRDAEAMNTFVEFTGPARLDKQTKRLTRRLRPGDIAIIDHRDIDRVSAEELVDSGARVVVNCSPAQTGRFPNPGPLLLVRGGVELIDVPGAELFETVSDGDLVSVRGNSVFRNGDCVASGHALRVDELTRALAEQRGRVTQALEEFAANTMRHLREEGNVLSGAVEFPALRTTFRDRHALVVARGPGMKRDLRIVRGYIRDFKPVLVAVDGGADALLEFGRKPDVIVGDMDSVSDEALHSGAEIVVHAYSGNGNAPGAARLDALGIPYHTVPAPGISEDLALLLAFEK